MSASNFEFFMVKLFLFALGLSIGSFINALVYRLHEKKPIVNDRSACPLCDHRLLWHDLIPLVSFAMLRGRCRDCHKRISWQYPLVELLTGIAFIFPFTRYSLLVTDYGAIISYYLFVCILLVIFAYDLRYMLIPDSISIPVIGIVFFIQTINHNLPITSYLVSALAASGFFLAQFLVSKGRWIGGGDIRLGFLIGLMLGWPVIVAVLMFAYILGTVITLPLVLLRRQTMKSQIPFGVFLTTSTIVGMMWGREIVLWYMKLANF
ncbi:MAG: Type 4 prepilin-like protein leader peptide-processing enzyme PilD [Parcubacteria group bacterium GW2011_GWC2_44_17]|nr:MAG: Type 4 prepilin-like protein leader peptide-processing enzyme PilD [Parcubacteria group bacterium GW2011_GWC2_44_17]